VSVLSIKYFTKLFEKKDRKNIQLIYIKEK
jgi:hypothetical protein